MTNVAVFHLLIVSLEISLYAGLSKMTSVAAIKMSVRALPISAILE